MVAREELLEGFRHAAALLSSGELGREQAVQTLTVLAGAFSRLGLRPNVVNEARGIIGNLVQVGQVGDPMEELRRLIDDIDQDKVELVDAGARLYAIADNLATLTSGGSVRNSVTGSAGSVLQAGTIQGDLHF